MRERASMPVLTLRYGCNGETRHPSEMVMLLPPIALALNGRKSRTMKNPGGVE
ncbi:Uncharacterized protein APZ42_000611 [Daphnia magna]|uniref:Uncharacterized protein n=1 Tax=Daphnia magna TaxID=35525 RepID=A0A164JI63_9CRUS|nr:Uncharacterized protein APZ42_000611 [Daphnia magna]